MAAGVCGEMAAAGSANLSSGEYRNNGVGCNGVISYATLFVGVVEAILPDNVRRKGMKSFSCSMCSKERRMVAGNSSENGWLVTWLLTHLLTISSFSVLRKEILEEMCKHFSTVAWLQCDDKLCVVCFSEKARLLLRLLYLCINVNINKWHPAEMAWLMWRKLKPAIHDDIGCDMRKRLSMRSDGA